MLFISMQLQLKEINSQIIFYNTICYETYTEQVSNFGSFLYGQTETLPSGL